MEEINQKPVCLKLEHLWVSKFLNHPLYIRNSKKRCHLPANQHCSYSFLMQLYSTVWLAVLHVIHVLEWTMLVEHREVSRWKMLHKYTTSIHSFDTRKHLCWVFPYPKFWNSTKYVYCYFKVHPHEYI